MTGGDRKRLKMSMKGSVLWCSCTSKISSPLGCVSLYCTSYGSCSLTGTHSPPSKPTHLSSSFAFSPLQSFDSFFPFPLECCATSDSFGGMAEIHVKYVGEDWALIPGPPPADPGRFCSSDLVPSVLFCNSYGFLRLFTKSQWWKGLSVCLVITLLLLLCNAQSIKKEVIFGKIHPFCWYLDAYNCTLEFMFECLWTNCSATFPTAHVKVTHKWQISWLIIYLACCGAYGIRVRHRIMHAILWL